MTEKDIKTASKFLSLVLRHNPEAANVIPDRGGWVTVDTLIAGADIPMTKELIAEVVATSDKQRFALSEDGQRIRANQGHSFPVDLGLMPMTPPETLFHGTATRFVDSIQAKGLIPGSRQHVHLSPDENTARTVGSRHGKPHVFHVSSGQMHRDGFTFICSDNGVWLTDHVPVGYLK
ncbi:RNA 2'-phosphotransferase [Halocynthiibacter styelae]|uniref:Probable RNA 2'-phosphotransferase n=1 Tax=Halocynthiibacter styelae TaxID=2761955 RepID=A0A8J7J3H5_9RHOB|nr:RNA 2'-phosphotransferase [Paenihalocynthiibacter styelae]MBI1492540.1 RNA 2'-phosphotransferase [Paenihalocynthiibacter styelae]